MKTPIGLVLVLVAATVCLTSFTDTATPSPEATSSAAPTCSLGQVSKLTLTPQSSTTLSAVTPTGPSGTWTPTVASRVVGVQTPPSGSQATMKLDMNTIFPPGEGREFVFANCLSSCHNFVPLLQQKTKEDWATLCRDHSLRHGLTLSLAEAAALCTYLQNHFNPETPLPRLPDWFGEGTSHPWGTFVGY